MHFFGTVYCVFNVSPLGVSLCGPPEINATSMLVLN